MERLEVPSSAAETESAIKALVANTKTLQAGLDRVTVNILRAISTTTAQALSGATTVTKHPDLQCSVRTSGGTVLVYGAAYFTAAAETQGMYLKLLVDEADEQTAGHGTTAGLGTTLSVLWFKELPAGQHTFKLAGQATNATMGLAAAPSVLYVVELMRG